MSTFINIGTYNDNHQDHHREMTVHVQQGTDVSNLVRQFFAEDIQAEDVTQQEQDNLPFLVPKKLEELNLYTLEQFADMYRKAAESDAKTFAMFLKKYRDLKVLDFQGYNKKEIFAAMRNFFPTMRQYSYDNFVAYY